MGIISSLKTACYLFPDTFEIIKMITPTTATTARMPTQTPALKIPSMAAQLLNRVTINKRTSAVTFFIQLFFKFNQIMFIHYSNCIPRRGGIYFLTLRGGKTKLAKLEDRPGLNHLKQ
jgi:hypothetical protein